MTVTIYSSPRCGACKQAKDYLDSENIEYTEIDVSIFPDAIIEMQEKSGAISLPTIIIKKESKEEIIIGYSKLRLRELIK